MRPRLDRDRVVRLATLLALIGLTAGYLVWRSHPAADVPPPGATPTLVTQLPAPKDTAAIVNLRLSRDQSQSRSLADLTQISQVADSASARQLAGDQASQLAQMMRKEQETDAILDAHGYFSATMIDSGQAEVLIASPELQLQQVEGIASFVESVTGLPPEAIRIVPQK